MPIGQDEGAENKDQRKKANGRLDCPVASCELEVQRDIVYGNKPGRIDRSRADEQKDRVDIPHELARENASGHAGQDGHSLLDAEQNEQHPRHDEQPYDLPTAPWVQRAPEVDRHDQGDDGANAEDGPEHIVFTQQLGCPCVGPRLERGNQEQVHWRKQPGNAEIEIERPAPCGRRFYKSATDDGAQDGADTPNETTDGTTTLVSCFAARGRDGSWRARLTQNSGIPVVHDQRC